MVATATQDPLQTLVDSLYPYLQAKQAANYGVSYKHDTPGGTLGPYSHGPDGLLTFPGVDRDVFHTVMGAKSFLGQLPSRGSVFTNPTYYILTGVEDDSGSEKDGVCDDAPIAGLIKACLTTSVFGRYERATREIDLGRLGARVDPADPMDLRLVGSPIADAGPFQGPENVNTPSNLLRSETARRFWERNVSFHRLLSKQIWTGNPSNNSANDGYKEMTGIDQLIVDTHVDIESGNRCEAADSYMVDFNYSRIDGSDTEIVSRLTDMYYQVKDRAMRTGVEPVRWVLGMRPQMFYELTALWPCAYLTYRCMMDGDGANRNNVDAAQAVQMRDNMRAGRYLLIDGERVEVVVDDAIPEETDADSSNVEAGCFSSSIYLIPMSIVGGQSVTFLEYFEFQNPDVQSAIGNMAQARIEGAFMTWPKMTNSCIQWQSRIEPRLIMRTPWLASKLSNVVYCPIQHTRSPFPDDPYFVDGGKTSRTTADYEVPWSE